MLRWPPEIVRGADDGVGDEMRQMRRDGEDAVVMRGVQALDHAAAAPPEGVELVDRGGVAVGQRRQDAPAAVEQLGEARFGARILGAGDRMAGNEMHARRHMGRHRGSPPA